MNTKNADQLSGELPWHHIDDSVSRPRPFNLQLPASIHAKMRYVDSMEPGGLSMRQQILVALDPFLEAKLKSYGIDG